MDFDNGDGFQPIQFDVAKAIVYDQSGNNENFEKTLRLRVHYGNKVVETKIPLILIPNSVQADLKMNTNDLTYTCMVNDNGFVPKNASVSILYGNKDQVLRKPVILVEGFESSTKPYGIITFEGLASGYIYDEDKADTVYSHMRLFAKAIDSLKQLEYDIIYIDNYDGKDYIQANALNAIKVIQWANEELIKNGSHEKLVVLGASMGGLVARYALAKMEADGCCHNTRLYGTFDSPHNGAHIPLGLQATAKYLHDELGWVDDVFNVENVKPSWEKVLMSPAAQQMLVSHLHPHADVLRSSFMAEFDSLGHPQDCRRIALINGSERGLSNHIVDGWKTFLQCEPSIALPFVHFPVGLAGILVNHIGAPIPFRKIILNSFAESRSDGIVFQHNELGQISHLAASILFVHGASYSIQSISAILTLWIPGIGPILNQAMLALQSATTASLGVLHLLNAVHSLFTSGVQNTTVSTPHYSESPGGTTNTPETIGEALYGIATVITLEHSFIPSVSGLDIDTSDFYIDIELTRQSYGRHLAPFDSYWAPGREDGQSDENQKHVEVTEENYFWLIKHIHHDYPFRDSSTGAYQGTLNTYFNHARPSGTDWDQPWLKFIHSLDVASAGDLHVNKAGPIEFLTSPYLNSSSQSFTLKTAKSCDQTTVRILDGGKITVGDALHNNSAELIFQDQSSLEVKSGGTLVIEDNSLLKIEHGAQLIIHPGASIQLKGPNARLVIDGGIQLITGASFKPVGSGTVVFNQAMISPSDVSHFWQVADSTRIEFANSMGDLIVQFSKTFYCPPVEKVIFNGVSVFIEPSYSVYITHSPVRFSSSVVSSSDTLNYHGGIHLAGQDAVIQNSVFKHGVFGLYNNASLGSGIFRIDNCRFNFNLTGLSVRDIVAFTANNCEAKFNEVGLSVLDAQGDFKIIGGSYTHNIELGIYANGQNGVTMLTRQIDLTNNGVAGVRIESINLRARCTNFSNNPIGIDAHDHNKLFMANSAQNRFGSNTIGIQLDNSAGVFITNGQNNFSGSQWYIQGSLNSMNSNPQLNLQSNAMPGTGNGISVSVPINVYWYDASGNPITVPLINWSPISLGSSQCIPIGAHNNYPGNHEASEIMRGYVSGKIINSNNYTNIWLHEALADAASNVSTADSTYDDLKALSRFHEILQLIASDSLTETEGKAVEYAIELMLSSINQAYKQGLVPRNGAVDGSQENSHLAMLTAPLQLLIQNNRSNAEQAQNLSLSLAQAYRMAEHYDYAENVLNAAIHSYSQEAIIQSDYWTCVCQAEDALIQKSTLPEEFTIQVEQCQSIINQSNKWSEGPILGYSLVNSQGSGALQEAQVIVYPLPANDYIHMDWRIDEYPINVELVDLGGRVLKTQKIEYAPSSSTMDVSYLPNGLYILHATWRSGTAKENIVINR